MKIKPTMERCCKITRLRCVPLILLTAGLGLSAVGQTTTPEDLIAGIDARIEQLFLAESGDPYTLVKVRASLDDGRPYYARSYSWSVVGYAARCFRLNESAASVAAANARLQQNARYYLRELTAADQAEMLPADAEKNTSTYSRIVDRDSFHWHADMVLRLIEMYGTNGRVAPGRITPETQAKCLEPIWLYVSLVSRLEKADYLNSKTWHLWESENHHVQCFSIAWQFSKIAKDLPAYQDRTYDNGATPAELYEAWNAYFIEYVRERFRKGLFVEMMSKGYNSESIRGVYNFYDFGDAEVKKHAGMYLDLFWAYWAQEQFNDVLGGGKARTTLEKSLTAEHSGISSAMAWLYFKLGVKPGLSGYSVNALLSSYRPKPVIADIAVDVAGRGTYEVRQTAQGLGLPAQTSWDQSKDLNPYRLNTDGGGIVRYSYCDPAFIMGTPMYKARPLNDWTAISSQGRQQGVVFSGAAEAARIIPCVLPSDEKYARNAFWTVQSKGSMITQMLSTHQGAEQMWAWISKTGLTDPVAENGILFVQTDEVNGAYAAIRPVGTNYTLIQNYDFSSFNPPGHWIVQLNDKFKPLILEVMAKDQVASFAAFKTLVKANTPTLNGGLLTYTTIYGDILTLDTTYANNPTINGVPVDYSPPKSYDSPFLHGDYNGETFVIEKGSRQEVYLIPGPPTTISTLNPLAGATNVSVAADLTITFTEDIVLTGNGTLTVTNMDTSAAVVISLDALPDVDGDVSVSGRELTIDLTSDLALDTEYAVLISSNAVEDAFGNAFAGITNTTTWNFTTEVPDTTPPTITSLSPADNATDVLVSANLVATFNEPVQPGTGNIVLKKSSDGSTVQTFDVATNVVFNGSQITITPSGMLDSTTGYYVTINATAVQDLAGNPYAGLSANTDWNFTTLAATAIVPVNTGAKVVLSSLANSSTTLSFDAGAGADMLIVAVSTERSSEAMYAVSYAGEPLDQAVESVHAGIWYLDLTSSGYSGGAADLVVDFTGITTVNGVGIGAVSVAAGGQPIKLHTTAAGADNANNVLLATTLDNTFNVACFNANGTGVVTVNAPLTRIYANGNIGSARGAAGYEQNVAAGNHTYSWTTGDPRRVVAAAFYIGNTFADWISAYSLGGLNNLADDPDGDRIPNAIEAWYGTHPGERSDGLGNLATDTTTTTFTHPQNENPPADLRLFYQWSTNLVVWYDCDGVDGPPSGETVSATTETVNTNATITAVASGPMDCLFLRAGIVRPGGME